MASTLRANDRAGWTEHKMGRAGPRRPTLMDSAWNSNANQGGGERPLKPGEVENDFEEKQNYQKKAQAATPPADSMAPAGPRGARSVKFTSEPAAALKLIDEKRSFAPPGTCMAPLQYRAGNGGAQSNGANNNGANAVPNADNDSMMNPFAKPWTPQVGQFQAIGVIQPMQPPMMQQQIPQIQQGIQPVPLGYQQGPMAPMQQPPMQQPPMQQPPMQQPMPPMQPPPPNATMPNAAGTMPNGAVSCFYATPTIQVATPYTSMAPMPQVSMVMVQNPQGPMSSPQADLHSPPPMAQPAQRMAPMAPIGPSPMPQMQASMAPQMGLAPPPVQQAAQPPQQPCEPPLGSPEFPSKGSALHAYRACKPCAFFYQEGCSNKEQCAFCHLCEPGERKRRKKERRMARRESQEG